MAEVAEVWTYLYHFMNSMALKCAVELRIADIIQSAAHPITLSQIASGINSPTLNIFYLKRVMRLLVRMKIFEIVNDTLYDLTPSSKLLLQDAEFSLAPMILLQTHPIIQAPLQYLSASVKEDGCAFQKAHGVSLLEFAPTNSEYNKLLNDGMKCISRVFMPVIISGYEYGFKSIESLVDVGGGTGQALAEIVKAFPHIKGFNFDLPHVVATAPELNGVTHVPGDMFEAEAIPTADAIYLKHILHNWGDEDCVKILKNCRRAIIGKSGKVIIVDPIVKADSDKLFGNADVIYDVLMMTMLSGAKERTEFEWKTILEKGGFPSYKIIELPNFISIIEASPE